MSEISNDILNSWMASLPLDSWKLVLAQFLLLLVLIPARGILKSIVFLSFPKRPLQDYGFEDWLFTFIAFFLHLFEMYLFMASHGAFLASIVGDKRMDWALQQSFGRATSWLLIFAPVVYVMIRPTWARLWNKNHGISESRLTILKKILLPGEIETIVPKLKKEGMGLFKIKGFLKLSFACTAIIAVRFYFNSFFG